MGVYLSSPITDKISVDSVCKEFRYGASSMQGWRMTQEDAHNCLPDFDAESDSAFFAVYDGHGGAEVAQYCALKFPDYLKKCNSYKEGSMKQALEDAFLGFDGTLTEEEVIRELRLLAGDDDKQAEEEDDGVPVGKTETDLLRQEADMPLDELLSKYKQPSTGAVRDLRKQQQDQILSPALRSKNKVLLEDAQEEADSSVRTGQLLDNSADSNNSSVAQNTNNSNVSQFPVSSNVEDKLINGHADNENNLNKEKEIQDSLNQQRTEDDAVSSSSSVNREVQNSQNKHLDSSDKDVSQSTDKSVSQSSDSQNDDVNLCQSSDSSCGAREADAVRASCTSEASSSGVTACSSSSADDGVPASSSGAGPSSSVDESGSSGGPGGSSIDDDEPGPSGSGSGGGSGRSLGGIMEADSEDDDDDDDEDEEYEEESEDEEEDEEEEETADGAEVDEDGFVDNPCMDMSNEEPGSDSGCTACVALLVKDQLYVANAGDSRCVLSRAGKAVDLSFDHKPEDAPERSRIEKAGGKVTSDGRVNRGLNLSRALGDHFYKRNFELSPCEQMITALPDIIVTSLQDDDEFIVLACDGIWNFMSSQEVVDMVRQKLQDPLKREKLSIVCEELFDYCLAPNTFGDGTGCDNMTCIIVMFNRAESLVTQNNKRCANDMEANSSSEEKIDEKKPRVEPESTQDDV